MTRAEDTSNVMTDLGQVPAITEFLVRSEGDNIPLKERSGSLMVLGTTDQITLPALSSVPYGWTHSVRATQYPSTHLSAKVNANGSDLILYEVGTTGFHYMVGGGEVWNFTKILTGTTTLWLAQIVVQPITDHLVMLAKFTENPGVWRSGSSDTWASVPFNTYTKPTFVSATSSGIKAPVTGLYNISGRYYFGANAGGGTNGSGKLAFHINNQLNTTIDFSLRNFILNEDSGFLNIQGQLRLNADDLVGMQFATSVSTLWLFDGNTSFRVVLVRR